MQLARVVEMIRQTLAIKEKPSPGYSTQVNNLVTFMYVYVAFQCKYLPSAPFIIAS